MLEIFTDEPVFTVILQVAVFVPAVAVIVAVPAETALTKPFASTVATDVLELLYVTVVLLFVLSIK